ncbi:MAG: diphosphomevalonate decarboxylase, partial [Flavobacteriales bacterium]
MIGKVFVSPTYDASVTEGFTKWKAPSNIALVKYWGKDAEQIPANPSLSFTLSTCATTTSIAYRKLSKPSETYSYEFFFDGKPKDAFRPKIDAFFNRIAGYMPFIKQYHFKIDSSNSFPHSSGIASSASGMAALALCLMELEKQLNPQMKEDYFYRKASFLARLGSGSACRSIEGDLVLWGVHQGSQGSSNLYGIKYPSPVHEHFKNYHDTILLVDKGQKTVSSTVGHNLMKDHPFAEQRFDQAHQNLTKLKVALESGNLEQFIEIVENEALTLHAMMLTSVPYFILMKHNTLE